MIALRHALLDARAKSIASEIRADYPVEVQEAAPGELDAAVAEAMASAEGYGIETWPGVGLLARMLFLLGNEAGVEARETVIAATLRDPRHATEHDRLVALVDAVAAWLDAP